MGGTDSVKEDAGDKSTLESEIPFEHGPSRREVLKAASTIAVAASATQLGAGDAAAQGQERDATTLERLMRSARDPGRRVLLKGGTIITMDAAVGDFLRGDLLIEGKRIAAVGPDLGAAAQGGNAIVIDAKDTILIPGMIDCHRHAWEGQIRGVIPNSATIGDYMVR